LPYLSGYESDLWGGLSPAHMSVETFLKNVENSVPDHSSQIQSIQQYLNYPTLADVERDQLVKQKAADREKQQKAKSASTIDIMRRPRSTQVSTEIVEKEKKNRLLARSYYGGST